MPPDEPSDASAPPGYDELPSLRAKKSDYAAHFRYAQTREKKLLYRRLFHDVSARIHRIERGLDPDLRTLGRGRIWVVPVPGDSPDRPDEGGLLLEVGA